MDSLTFSHVSVFVVTLEVAIAVISLVPLSAAFAFVAVIAWKHEGPETFYPEEIGPLFTAACVVFTTIYILQAFQLLIGILLLKSFALMDINLWGAIKTSWCWLGSSVITLSALCYLTYLTVVEYESIVCRRKTGSKDKEEMADCHPSLVEEYEPEINTRSTD